MEEVGGVEREHRMSWSPGQYGKFEDERNRPVHDLLAQIPNAVSRAADLGCGPGNSTELLIRRFPDATVVGMDSSEEMIRAAKQRLPNARFELGDLASWPERPFDLVFANAPIQWVPDHAALLPFLFGKLAPGGSLAVQLPDNLDEPAHRIMREVAAEGPRAEKLRDATSARAARHTPEWYYRELRALGASVNVWRTTYHHPLNGAAALVEWFKGSGLRPFLRPLDESERAGFLARYTEALEAAYPALPDGTVLLPFPRLFFVATRAA
jgi:trans-aconitate 2-methyltransferase